MKKSAQLFLGLLCLAPLSLTSCGGGTTPEEDGVTTLDMFLNGGNSFDGLKRDSIWKKIEEDTGVKMAIRGATHNSDYYTTLNPMINTGSIPDVIFAVPNNAGNSYNNWVDQEIIWNIDELLAEKPGEYPYIEAILGSDQFKNLTFGNNAHTLLPYLSSESGWGIYYRADWLINIGYYTETNGVKTAKTPETIEEFQDVLMKFTLNDPDGDGKNNTYGISPFGKAFYMNPLYHAFGVTPDYDLDRNDKGEYMFLTPEFKNFLTWAQDMYAKGYIDPQFAVNNNEQDRDKFYSGTTGILITNAEMHVSWIANSFENANGKGKLILGKAPIGTKNLGVEGAGGFSSWGGYWGGFSISKLCKNPHAAMRLFNYLYSPEGSKLRSYGIKDQHYSIDDEGNYIPNLERRNEEPTGTFYQTKNEDGDSMPTGYYKMGTGVFGSDIDWDSALHFKVRRDPNGLDANYKDLIEQGLKNNTVVRSRLYNVTGYYSSYTNKMKKVEDASNIFAINAIMGKKNLTTDWDALMNQVNQSSYDYKNIQRMLEELAKKAGIIQ